MGVYKTLDIELQELDMEVNFSNKDDLFDLVIDSKLSNVKLSDLMRKCVVSNIYENVHLQPLMWNEEFVTSLEWHYA
jgi:hypothetical protein